MVAALSAVARTPIESSDITIVAELELEGSNDPSQPDDETTNQVQSVEATMAILLSMQHRYRCWSWLVAQQLQP